MMFSTVSRHSETTTPGARMPALGRQKTLQETPVAIKP